MNYQIFSDFDAYEDAIQHANVRMTLHHRDRPEWAVGQMSLGPMDLQWGTSGGGMVTEGQIRPGGYALFVPLNNWSTNRVNGRRLSESSIMVAASGSEFCISADGWNDWFSLFVSHDSRLDKSLDATESSLTGCRVANIGSRRLRSVRRAVYRLIKLVSGDEVSNPVVFRTAEATLQQLARSAFAERLLNECQARGRPMIDRRGVVRMVADDLAPTEEHAVCVRDLSEAAQISERTLHRVFHDWFGISPVRYARLRLLHSVRDALLAADPTSTTVTAIFVQHDIDQFGRFAGAYRSLFGELPSQTLHRGERRKQNKKVVQSVPAYHHSGQ